MPGTVLDSRDTTQYKINSRQFIETKNFITNRYVRESLNLVHPLYGRGSALPKLIQLVSHKSNIQETSHLVSLSYLFPPV